jgi:hypothetical protein
MNEYLFLCCFWYNGQLKSSNKREQLKHQQQLKNKKVINKNMIGLPTNFQHFQHIGCSEMAPTIDLSKINYSMVNN